MEFLKIITIFLCINFSLLGSDFTLINNESKAWFFEQKEEFFLENPSATDRQFISYIAVKKSISRFAFDTSENGYFIFLERRQLITRVSFDVTSIIDKEELSRVLNLDEQFYLSGALIDSSKSKIESYLSDLGITNSVVTVDKSRFKDDVLKFIIDIKRIENLREIEIKTDNDFFKKELYYRLRRYRKKSFNRSGFKIITDNFKEYLINSGFFGSTLDYKVRPVSGNLYDIEIDLKVGSRYLVQISGNKQITREELKLDIARRFNQDRNALSAGEIEKYLIYLYRQRNIFKSRFNVSVLNGKDKNGTPVQSIYIRIFEGFHYKLVKTNFNGNYFYSNNKISKLLLENGSELTKRNFFDKTDLEDFSDALTTKYHSNGFVFAKVSEPIFEIDDDKGEVTVTYSIRERQTCLLEDIVINGLPEKFVNQVKKIMINKVDSSLNVIEIDNDIERILDYLKANGYLFAKLKNNMTKDVISYDSNYRLAKITLDFQTYDLAYFGDLIISGNKKTKLKVIKRENHLSQNDLVTPDDIKKIKSRLLRLGIFTDVKVTPIVVNTGANKVNLIIDLKERLNGYFEIAPGFRTDLGFKLSTVFKYRNLTGYNDDFSFETQGNLRTSLSSFDERRRLADTKKLEYFLQLGYGYPYAFNFVDTSIVANIQRKRFYSFDAEIFKLSPQISKTFFDVFTVGLQYQWEKIRQFDATLDKDREVFQIGSITPTVTLDLRDSKIRPKSGAYFSYSLEIANPTVLSQSNEESEIDYYKFIGRNRAYIPLDKNKTFVLATSASFGYQKNNSRDLIFDSNGNVELNDNGEEKTLGYIPSLKVFHLDSIDGVRGYSFSEINRVRGDIEIDDLRIQDEVYFLNFKFEPRYYYDEGFALGLFFDAGRLFVDNFKPLDLRTSVGISFKVLTQVGNLDFDYGVKTRRYRSNSLGRESFGRFHLSIGFF